MEPMPAAYSGFDEDYAALRSAAGLVDLSSWGKLFFDGPDRKKFLNGLLTNDVAGLPSSTGFPCCILTPKGKLRGDFMLYDAGERLLAVGLPAAIANLKESIAKVLTLSQTRMQDESSGHGLFLLAGPKAEATLQAALGAPKAAGPCGVRSAEWKGETILLLGYPRLGVEGCFLVVRSGRAKDLRAFLLESGVKPVGAEAFEALRVEAGLPLFGVDMDEESMPQEARLEEAISFTKGCYMGQETISRIKHLGHVNKLIVGLKLAGEDLPSLGAPIFAGETEIGKLTSAVRSPKYSGVLALATLRAAESSAGTKVEVSGPGGRRPAEIIMLRGAENSHESRSCP